MTESEEKENGSVESGMPEESGAGIAEPISFVQHVILVFSDPASAFEKLVARPRWIGAFLLVLVVSMPLTLAQ